MTFHMPWNQTTANSPIRKRFEQNTLPSGHLWFFPCMHNQTHLAIFVVSARKEKKNPDLGKSWHVRNCQILQSTIWVRNILSLILLCWNIHHNLAQQKTFPGPSIGCQISTITKSFQKFCYKPFTTYFIVSKRNCSCNNTRFSTRQKNMMVSNLTCHIHQKNPLRKDMISLFSSVSICQSKFVPKATEKGFQNEALSSHNP